jgi:hypothetical protein
VDRREPGGLPPATLRMNVGESHPQQASASDYTYRNIFAVMLAGLPRFQYPPLLSRKSGDGEGPRIVPLGVAGLKRVERCPIGALSLEVLVVGCTMHILLKEKQSVVSLREMSEPTARDTVYTLAKRPCRLVSLDTSYRIVWSSVAYEL